MASNGDEYASIYLLLEEILQQYQLEISFVINLFVRTTRRKRKRRIVVQPYRMIDKIPDQVKHLHRMVGVSDIDCIVNLRMDRNCFGRLCFLLRHLGGLSDGIYVSVEEQAAMFLGILAHDKKNKIVRFDFWRSGQTISHYLHVVLKAILKLHGILLVKPEPVPEDCTDPRWKWFKGCLGALDGTYINVMVRNVDKPRYRTRKGQICTNTLAVSDRNMKFVYVLLGWEGSAADSRVLRDAVNREHGLKVSRGTILGITTYVTMVMQTPKVFLSPYKNVRYHLKEWGFESERPRNAQEMFNMRHTKARNVIERAFGIMKMRWGIFRSASYYPVKVHNRLIMACFLLHNFIRSEMVNDPIEELIDENPNDNLNADNYDEDLVDEEFVDAIETSPEWNRTRDAIAEAMWTA